MFGSKISIHLVLAIVFLGCNEQPKKTTLKKVDIQNKISVEDKKVVVEKKEKHITTIIKDKLFNFIYPTY